MYKTMGLVLPAALGLMMGSTAAVAENYFDWYAPLQPKQGVVTISLSGECKGKVALDLVSMEASSSFTSDEDGNVLPNHGFGYGVRTADYEFSFGGGSGSNSLGEKFSHSVSGSKVKQSQQLTTHGYFDVDLDVLKHERYEDALRCKNGQSFRESSYEAELAMGSSSLSHKSTLQLAFDTSEVNFMANAVLKQQISGNLMAYQGVCSNKGLVNSSKYTVTCEPMKPVRVKIAVSAKGSAYQGR